MIAGLLLAAGRSRRFGSDKLTAKLDGVAVVRRSAKVLASLDVIHVVVAPGADMVMQALSRLDLSFVVNLARDEGMASSIRAGVQALAPGVEAVVIALGDQPLADAGVTRRLVERWREGGTHAVAPVYRDGQGNPVLFDRSCFPALLELRGDVGARSVLDAPASLLARVEIDADIPADVDTPELLSAMNTSVDRR